MNRFAGLLAVFEQAESNTSIGITGKRRALVIEALRIAAAHEAAMSDPTTPVLPAGVPVVLAFSHQRIADMISTCLDTPVGDWLHKASVVPVENCDGIETKLPRYGQGAYWSKIDAALRVVVDNPVNDGQGDTLVKTLRMEQFQHALTLMATKDEGAYSRHFADFLRSNEDAGTADLFMQFAVYGEEVFA